MGQGAVIQFKQQQIEFLEDMYAKFER